MIAALGDEFYDGFLSFNPEVSDAKAEVLSLWQHFLETGVYSPGDKIEFLTRWNTELSGDIADMKNFINNPQPRFEGDTYFKEDIPDVKKELHNTHVERAATESLIRDLKRQQSLFGWLWTW